MKSKTFLKIWPKAGVATEGIRILVVHGKIKGGHATGGVVIYRPSTGKLRAIKWEAYIGPDGKWIVWREMSSDSTRCCRQGRPVFSRKREENAAIALFIGNVLTKLLTPKH